MKINPETPLHFNSATRRKFILTTAKSAAGLALVSANGGFNSDWFATRQKEMTVQQVMDLILKEGGLSHRTDTVDTLKFGKPDQIVSGIVTTMFPTISVIEQAARLKANFIMAHEPSYYNHRDDTSWVQNNDVLQQKQELLQKHGMVIWRFHDYCHALRPDAVSYGVAKKAGWLSYYKTSEIMLTIPPASVQQLATHLKKSLGIDHLRVIGNLQQRCERVALLPGAWGGQRQVSAAITHKPDVLVVGEVAEWETAEFVRDANLLGKKISLIVLGHSVSEEPGMEWMVEWLKPKLPNIKITHIASGNPFTWI